MLRIEWHGFLEDCAKEKEHEICAWLYSDKPYGVNETWHMFRVKEVPTDWDKDGFAEGFMPDVKDLARVGRLAKKERLVHLGNVHTHLITKAWHARGFSVDVESAKSPSHTDLSYAAKYRDVVRGIVVVGDEGVVRVRFCGTYDTYIMEFGIEELKDSLTSGMMSD